MENELSLLMQFIFGEVDGRKRAEELKLRDEEVDTKVVLLLLRYITEKTRYQSKKIELEDSLTKKYESMASLFEEKLSKLSLTPDALPPHVYSDYNLQAEAAELLDMGDSEIAILVVVISERLKEFLKLGRAIDTKAEQLADIQEKTDFSFDKLSVARDFLQRSNEQLSKEISVASREEGKIEFLEAKWSEYEAELAKLEEILHENGFNPVITHSSLLLLREKCDKLSAEISETENRLHEYHGLPPTLDAAKEKLLEKRRELEKLEALLSDKLESIDFTSLDMLT